MAEVQLLVSSLKLRIKEWEYTFRKHNARLPSREDIKKNPAIYNLYKAYKSSKDMPRVLADSLQSEDVPQTLTRPLSSASVEHLTIPLLAPSLASPSAPLRSRGKLEHSPFQTHNNDNAVSGLGPTPQANGKVISIFDFHSTPPDSSPMKAKDLVSQNHIGSTDIFKTPTKPASRVEQASTPVTSVTKRTSLSQKLFLASQDESERGLVTPQYLGRVNRKFDFTSPGNISGSPAFLHSLQSFTTPTKSAPEMDFLISPSPLKSHRFMLRKLKDVFEEVQQEKDQNLTPDELALDEMLADMEKSQAQDQSVEPEPEPKRRKKFTQKRTTRRFKIKARYNDKNDGDKAGTLAQDQHQQDQAEFSEAESDDSQEEYVRPKILNPKGQAPGATNFQRLKINDPRAKKFKRRMANRRF